MIEITPEGFKILIGRDDSRQFMIESDRIDECISYIQENDIRFIGINSFLGYKRSDINFLSEIRDFVEGVVVSDTFADISILNSLTKIKTLGFRDNKNNVIDLSNFPDLSTLACDYSKRLVSLESCEQLRNLTLTGFMAANQTIEEIPALPSLITLNLFLLKNVISLSGISHFPILRGLVLLKANQLRDIRALKQVKHSLKCLEFDHCKKIDNYDVLGEMTNLEKIIISSSSPIKSLGFVKPLVRLNFISFVGTDVIDGDLSPTIGIGYVGFENKPHYSLTFEDISALSGK